MIDLHIHSIFSDGILSIEEIVEICRKRNVKTIAITDHDNFNSVKYIKSIEIPPDLTFIPGIEMSTESHYLDRKTKIHLLGYGFDEKNPILIQTFNELYNKRSQDNQAYIEELIKKYHFLSKEHFQNFDYGKYGWIKKLILLQLKEQITEEQKIILTRYLDAKKPTYHGYNQQSEKAIRVIKDAGGYVIFAHPPISKLSKEELDKMVQHLKQYGLDGIETYHSLSTPEEMALSHSLATKYNLYETAGSDYHLDDKFCIEIGRGIDNNIVQTELPLVKRLNKEGKVIK